MRHSEYEALFKSIAEQNKLIRHRADFPRFARIITSVDPLQRQVDLMEMQETLLGRYLTPNPGEQVLVLESMQTHYADNGGDNYTRQRHGAFFVLEQKTQTLDAWHVLDRTEENGEQVLAAARQRYENQVKVRWPIGAVTADQVGPVGSNALWYGTRFDFEIIAPANAALAYNPAFFLPTP